MLLSCVLALGAVDAAVAPVRAGADEATVSAQVGSTPSGQPMAPGYVGLSIEYRALHQYTGRDPAHVNPVLIALLRGLAPSGRQVLRIGGDSTDQTWWPMRGVIPPGGVNYDLTEGWLRTAHALAVALRAKLILGINLAANRPALAGAEARALIRGVGRTNIQALEIGNEPDLYGFFTWFRDRRGRVVHARPYSYSMSSLIAELRRWRAAMPPMPLAGPAFSSLSWMPGLGHLISGVPALADVTFHRYPLTGCVIDPIAPGYASIANLLSDSASAGLAAQVAPYVQVAHSRRLPFRLDELNSASCEGRWGTSDSFGAALWLLDTLFNMAAVGVDAVNLHTLPGAPYEPITFTQDRAGWHAFVRPSYYGALMFDRAFPPGAQLLPVSAPPGPVKVWATVGPDGHTRVVVINKGDTATSVSLSLPNDQAPLTSQSLLAPSIGATSGVTLAGQGFGTQTTTGVLAGAPQTQQIQPSTGTFTVPVAAYSAVLLTQ